MKFLLADDELFALQSLKKIVIDVVPNAEISGFTNSVEALDYIKSNRFDIDIAMLDINMPVINGLQLASAIRSRNPRANIIFCTGYSEYAIDAFGLNASGYLIKPITKESFYEQLQVLRFPSANVGLLEIKCFGLFNVLYNGRPVLFSRKKAKEIFAILVDKRGVKCSYNEIKEILWEDNSGVHDSYFRDLKRNLINTFKDYEIQGVIIDDKKSLALDTSKVSCDYYDWLEGRIAELPKFAGEYMPQYSWAEITNAEINNE